MIIAIHTLGGRCSLADSDPCAVYSVSEIASKPSRECIMPHDDDEVQVKEEETNVEIKGRYGAISSGKQLSDVDFIRRAFSCQLALL